MAHWRTTEIEKLDEMFHKNFDDYQICEILKRSPDAIQNNNVRNGIK